MTRFRILTVALCLLVVSPMVFAHAILVRSTPADGFVVHRRNVELVLDYNSRIEAKRCTLRMRNANGQSVPLRMEAGKGPAELRAMAGGLENGKYTIHWQVLASDGHITRGDISFTVAAR